MEYRGVTYEIPKNEVASAALTPRNMLFVLVRPPRGNTLLSLDAFKPYLSNKLGTDVPTISGLNDNRFGTFKVIKAAGGPVICSLGPEPHYNCGLSINDGPVKWGVLFDKAQVASAQSIRRQAQAAIDRYRTGANPSRRI